MIALFTDGETEAWEGCDSPGLGWRDRQKREPVDPTESKGQSMGKSPDAEGLPPPCLPPLVPLGKAGEERWWGALPRCQEAPTSFQASVAHTAFMCQYL